MDRYKKNFDMLSREDMKKIKESKVIIIGVGGLGGYILEMLSRIGVGEITIVDYDKFDKSNLNRQIYSDEYVLGLAKVDIAKERINRINSEVLINAINQKINKENIYELIKSHDLVLDGLDSIEMRFIVNETTKKLEIPYIYGAISSWYGQVSTIMPKDETLSKIYREKKEESPNHGNPSFTPALIASIQVSEAIKYIIGRGELLSNKMLTVDTFSQDFEIIELN